MDKWISEDEDYRKLKQIAVAKELEKNYFGGKASPKLPPFLANTLIFYGRRHPAVYIAPSMKVYMFAFKKRTNGYLLLEFLAKSPSTLFSVDELANKHLNDPRSGGNSTPDRRVRDTIKELRDLSKLSKNKDDDCFMVGNGFGLKCSVVLA